MRRILATGTTGTIGKHFGSKVEGLDINLSLGIDEFRTLNIIPSDSILHAAALVGPSVVGKDIKRARSINVDGARNLAVAARDKGVSRFVYLSTSHVYAPSNELLTETSLVLPSNIYAEQKLEAEFELTEVFRENPEKLCIVRIFSVLDWDVSEFTLGGGIKKLAQENSDYKLSNADDIRDFLTPRSIARCLIHIVRANTIYGVVNLSTGVGTTVRAAAQRMLVESGFEFLTDCVVGEKSGFPVMVGNNSKLVSYLPNLDLVWKPSSWVLNGNI